MSLKHFHIFFITASIILCLGFGGWGVSSYFNETDGATNLLLGVLGFALGVVLIWYGYKVFDKLRLL